jgi:orotidine-5'-phosphate decarboxylase
MNDLLTNTDVAAGDPTTSVLEPKDQLIVALDFGSSEQALELVDRLDGSCRWFKVGMELFYAAGAGLIETLRRRDFEVFLDLKLHDIPNTVAGAIRSVSQAGATLLTVHAGGGEAMMAAAAEAANAPGAPRLLAVTVLTSMDAGQLAGVGIMDTPSAQVLRLARLAKLSGINGMVSSAAEVEMLRDDLGPDTLLVIPGIRAADGELGDQRRVATPAAAIQRGASKLVVGCPITRAVDPAAAARAFLDEIAKAQ